MPELPEVETVRRGAEPHLKGRTLRGVELRRADLRWPMPKTALRGLIGRRCTAVERRAKYLLLRFSGAGAPVALVHLGMTGRFAIEAIGRRAVRPEWRPHEHWRMDFGDRLVRYIDARRFGVLDVAAAADLEGHRLLRGLGVEPLLPAFDAALLYRITRGRRAAVKTLLMDARLLVGVGNIYASEACHRARVRPGRAAGRLVVQGLRRRARGPGLVPAASAGLRARRRTMPSLRCKGPAHRAGCALHLLLSRLPELRPFNRS
jgi:formamidopyrimidine-DNA glycosylase